MNEEMAISLTVFVCSTFSDLSGEREAVLDAIRRLQLQHDSMEFFGARDRQPIETCLQEVRKSDVLVVIVGHRYGTIVPNIGLSYSEAEYSEGYRLGKPCLVYIRDENVPILPRYMERDPQKLALLEKWKATLQERHTVAAFQDGSGLAIQVAADLIRTIQDLEEIARTKTSDSSQTNRDMIAEVSALVSIRHEEEPAPHAPVDRLHAEREEEHEAIPSILNRAAGRSYLENGIAQQVDERKAHTVTVAILDIDDLTLINKQYGIPVGDRVLERIARLLRNNIPSEHAVGRCGDDTFFAVFLHLAEAKAESQCRLLIRKIAGFKWSKIATNLRVTCSVGFATKHPGEPVRDTVIRAAIGMGGAKARGKNVIGIAAEHISRNQSRELRDYFS